jgi:diguanylate cyclase (GGDEF)-like protein
MKWDVFVSHAFEDREFARALADGLSQKGLRVWFDGFELNVGDSLRRSIDYGLAQSRFGAVVLSPSFFAKEWTQKELDALIARETKEKRIVLPIYLNISAHQIQKHSPMLADRYAIDSVVGIDKTVENLFFAMKKHEPKKRPGRKKNVVLSAETMKAISTELQRIKNSLANKETELKAVLAQADELANTDAVTFLPNRRRIIADLQREILFSKRYGTPLCISIVDIDNFKKINDAYGHIVGDHVMTEFSSIIREPILYPDSIGRYGGDEFLVVMPHTNTAGAIKLAEKLSNQMESIPIIYQKSEYHLTISIGISQYNNHDEDWSELFARADKALYCAKRNGHNQWSVDNY